jgi:hypothetical protein
MHSLPPPTSGSTLAHSTWSRGYSAIRHCSCTRGRHPTAGIAVVPFLCVTASESACSGSPSSAAGTSTIMRLSVAIIHPTAKADGVAKSVARATSILSPTVSRPSTSCLTSDGSGQRTFTITPPDASIRQRCPKGRFRGKEKPRHRCAPWFGQIPLHPSLGGITVSNTQAQRDASQGRANNQVCDMHNDYAGPY